MTYNEFMCAHYSYANKYAEELGNYIRLHVLPLREPHHGVYVLQGEVS